MRFFRKIGDFLKNRVFFSLVWTRPLDEILLEFSKLFVERSALLETRRLLFGFLEKQLLWRKNDD